MYIFYALRFKIASLKVLLEFIRVQLFARKFLLVKKLEIEETKTTLYSTFKTDTYNKSGLSFFDFQLFY